MLIPMRARAAAALLASALLASALACGRETAPLYPAGSTYDDGHGDLALASMRLLIGGDGDADGDGVADGDAPAAQAQRAEASDDPDAAAAGGSDGAGLGGAAYGGDGDASYVVPTWRSAHLDRKPRYRQVPGLSGAVEGAITWRGAAPRPLTTACGAIEPLALAGDRLAGALVYIERVSVGRPISGEGRPASVGGVLVRNGCALAPAVQIATPLPAPLLVHAGAQRMTIRVTSPTGPARTYELEEGGRAGVQIGAGVTRVDDGAGAIASAWIVGLETPYFAVTDDRGRYRIDELAAGTYELTIWHPPVPSLASGALAYGAPIVARRTVRVERDRATTLDVHLGP
jgi:hypothetical protein